MNKLIVISLGGSIVMPGDINMRFLKSFRNLIISQIKKGHRFIIIVGGGKVSRDYMNAASKISKLTDEDIDWLGIHGTRMNAHLLRTIFRDYAHKRVIKNPKEKNIKFKEKILIAAGWKPGWSTDYDAVLLARNFKVKTIINMTKLSYVYTKDPDKHKDAKPLKQISWGEYRKIVGDQWHPGLNAPFDPVASKLAQKLGLKVIILKGTAVKNLKKCIQRKKFVGTVVQ
jgi:uridylate kinase